MERAGHNIDYRVNYKLTEQNLRKINDILLKSSQDIPDSYIKYSVERKNSSHYVTDDIEQILSEDNSKDKSIVTLRIGLLIKSDNLNDRFLVNINFHNNNTYYGSKISLDVSGKDRNWCFILFDELDSQIKRTVILKRYEDETYRLSALAFSILMLFAFFGLTILLNDHSTQYDSYTLEKLLELSQSEKLDFIIYRNYDYSLRGQRLVTFIACLVGMLISFALLLSSNFFSKLHSFGKKSTFYWRDEISIYDSYVSFSSNIKWCVIVASLISVTAGIFVSYFFNPA
ncbi:hypothetical protein C942_00841 [Photobacterium marinum]|uniref:Uncharacterized protein n=1 Tax=Photobacterium marinum TaxID=1056511 RepID=L8JA84_9GAMM|nr:hypothetical protein [Photobacterium marinum]ELR65755.1 hypothetical protein C942_00841 [Photobacterium marinum]